MLRTIAITIIGHIRNLFHGIFHRLLHILLRVASYISHLLPSRFDEPKLRVKVFVLRYLMRFLGLSNTFIRRPLLNSGGAVQTLRDEIVGRMELHTMTRDDGLAPSGAIEIAGWVVSKSGIEKIEVYCDEKFVGDAYYGVLRPDIAKMYPDFCNPGRSGFFLKLDATQLAKGKHELTVVAFGRSGEVADLIQKIRIGDVNDFYQRWIAMNTLTEAKRKALCAEIESDESSFLISMVAVADANTDSEMLHRTLDSLKGQLYEKWELVICADSKVVPMVKALLDAADAGSRVKLATHDEVSWHGMFAACSGNYIGVINVGDVLDSRALWAVAKNANATPNADLIYADEDRLENSKRIDPRFKSAWSPFYLQSYNYIGRPWFGSASLLRSIAIVGEPCNVASEYSLLIRLGKIADKVVHVPMVLCSRGTDAVQQSSGGEANQFQGSIKQSQSGGGTTPKVSIVIPTCLRDLDIIEKCFSSLLTRTDYSNLEVIVVKNNVANEEVARRFLERWPFKVISWDGPFNWSGINNFGAQHATGELLLFMNDDVEALHGDWLANMVSIAIQESVGAVGAMLMYPNQTIQHGGVYFVNYGGGARHLFKSCKGTEAQIAPMVNHSRECSAVTGACLLSRRDVFDAINGFDELLPLVSNDTDYCLRLEEKGFACIVAAGATLVHHEGISRAGMSETEDNKRFWARWKQRLESCDPYSNPNIDDWRDDWWLNPKAMGTLNGRVRSGMSNAIRASSLTGALHGGNLQEMSH